MGILIVGLVVSVWANCVLYLNATKSVRWYHDMSSKRADRLDAAMSEMRLDKIRTSKEIHRAREQLQESRETLDRLQECMKR